MARRDHVQTATTSAVSWSIFEGGDFDVERITLKFDSAPTTSENITLTKDSIQGAAYDTLLLSFDPAADSATDVVIENVTGLRNGDKIVLAYTNTDGNSITGVATVLIGEERIEADITHYINGEKKGAAAAQATSGGAALTTGGQLMGKASTSLPAAVDNGDAVAVMTDEYGRVANASHDLTTASDSVTESDPVSAHHAEETLLDLTNITTNTTGYGYLDMDGYRFVAFEGITSGTAPTDVLTVTIEGSIQDDGTAAASCDYVDISNAAFGFGAASWVDTDFMLVNTTPLPCKYVRIKYVTSNGGGGDCDLTVYAKRMY